MSDENEIGGNGNGISEIVAKIESDAPEISHHVENQTPIKDENNFFDSALDDSAGQPPGQPAGQPAEKDLNVLSDKKDKYGRAFDPSLHVTDAQGGPVIGKKLGTLKIRPGKMPKNQGSATTSKSIVGQVGDPGPGEPGPGEPGPGEPQPAAIDPNKSAAVQATELTYTLMRALFGTEGEPIKIENTYDEKEVLQDRYFDYFQVAGPINIPPHWLLAGHMALMVKCRFDMPPVKKRFTRVKDWIAIKFRWLGLKIRKDKGKDKDAQSMHGNQSQRENDASPTDS